MSGKSLEILQEKLDYVFRDKKLLSQAFRHSSVVSKNQQSYERLEFLGDRILGLGVSDLLYKTYPMDNEGELARRHSPLVSFETLLQIALDIGIDILIKGETKDFSKNHPSVLADVVEAILAVIYLESGLKEAQRVINLLWAPLVIKMLKAPKDPKSGLQEWAHRNKKSPPCYCLKKRSGPDHNPVFMVEVSIDKSLIAKAEGSSLKQAEKKAAIALLEELT